MKPLKSAILTIGLIVGSNQISLAGDHFFKHQTSTVTTWTTTTGSPVLLLPTVQPVYYTTNMMVPVNHVTTATLATAAVPIYYTPVHQASPTLMYYYYQAPPVSSANPTALVTPATMTAPSLLAPASTALPMISASSAAAPAAQPTGTMTVETHRTARLLLMLRGFAASNNLERSQLTSGLRNVSQFFVRSELAQYGLGGFIPSPTDNNVIEELVNKVVLEKIGPAAPGSVEAPATAGNQFVFQGPVTLSFPNVQTVQIPAPTTSAGTQPAQPPSTNPGTSQPPSSVDVVPPAPIAPGPR